MFLPAHVPITAAAAAPHPPTRRPPTPPLLPRSVLEAGKSKRYCTFATHAWICREAASGVRMLCNGRSAAEGTPEEQAVDVTAPPLLAWTVRSRGRARCGSRAARPRGGMLDTAS